MLSYNDQSEIDVFTFPNLPPLYQGNTLSLTIAVVSLVVFLNAYKTTSFLRVLACLLDIKTQTYTTQPFSLRPKFTFIQKLLK